MVEPVTSWVKSSFCADSACLEVAIIDADVAVRDSKDANRPFLTFSKADWNAFVEAIAAEKQHLQ
jgi:hypothetical protein